MYTMVLRVHVKDKKEFARRVREGFVQRIREVPGFRGYYGVDGDGDTWVGIFVTGTREEAEAAREQVLGYTREQGLAELITSGPELIVMGDTVISEMREQEHEERRAA